MNGVAQARSASGTIRNVETFAAGEYPGDEPGETWDYSDADVRQIVRNFALLSKGPDPIHRVPVVVTHDDVNAWGWVDAARMSGDVLTTDWGEVEPSLQRAIKQKRLLKVSPEIKRDFTDKDGRVYPGPYLYRVAVLGADVPRVKGLKDIPRQFADRKPGHRVARRFAVRGSSKAMWAQVDDAGGSRSKKTGRYDDDEMDGNWHERYADPMDRTAAIQFLQSKGVDPSLLTDAVPDSVIIGIAMAWQSGDASNTPDTREHADNDQDPYEDPTLDDEDDRDPWGQTMPGQRDHADEIDDERAARLGWEGDPDDDDDMAGYANQRYRDRGRGRRPRSRPKKVTVTRQFSDPRTIQSLVQRAVRAAMGKEVRRVGNALKRQQAAAHLRAIQERQQAVRLFCDQKAKEGRITPAENDEGSPMSLRARLLRIAAQKQTTHKFADPKTKKEVSRSELQLQMDEIDGREVRRFSERVRSGAVASGDSAAAAPDDGFRNRLVDYYKKQLDRLPAKTN